MMKTPAKPARKSSAKPAEKSAALGDLRQRIDSVDEQIHQLINERARLARSVGISKHEDGHLVDFYRPEREAQVLRMALERNERARGQGALRDEEIVRLFREIMSACADSTS
jgi:chorismate mutase/prephenate dehydratase